MRKITLCCLLTISVLGVIGNQALAQNNWEQYKPGTLKAIEDQHNDQSLNNKITVYTGDTFPTLVTVVYTGKHRKTHSHKSDHIKDWLKTVQRDLAIADLYENEYLFIENSKEYWIPVQKQVAAYFTDEAKEGDKIRLYAIWIGGRKIQDKFDWVFLVNEFETETHNLKKMEPEESTFLKSANGFLLVHQDKGVYFTIDFSGKALKSTSSERVMFDIDETVYQVNTAPKTDFLSQEDKLSDEMVLQKHMDWEGKYLSDMFKTKLSTYSEKKTIGNNRAALLWCFAMPREYSNEVKHQCMLTTVVGDHVLILNAPVKETEIKNSKMSAYLITTMETLKVSITPINIKKLQEELQKKE